MQNAETISQQIDVVMQETDAAFEMYESKRQFLADIKMQKYERTELETGEVVFIPLEVLMDELSQAEIESKRFVTALNGRTTKDERASELEGWMKQNSPLYSDYTNRLQNQEIQETVANAASAIAEKDYGRLHTKIMALRGQLEFKTASENTFTKAQEIDAVKEQKKAQLDISRESAVQEQEAKNSALNLIKAKQKLEDTRNETAKILVKKAGIEKEIENMRVDKEVEKVKATAAEELEQYKHAVQPLLHLAQTLRELQMPKAQQQPINEDKYNEALKTGWVTP